MENISVGELQSRVKGVDFPRIQSESRKYDPCNHNVKSVIPENNRLTIAQHCNPLLTEFCHMYFLGNSPPFVNKRGRQALDGNIIFTIYNCNYK